MIRHENDRSSTSLAPDEVIRIPPLPVLAQRRRTEYKNIIRFFDYENHTYAITENLYRIPETGKFALIDAADLPAERQAYMTVIRVRRQPDFDRAFSTQFLHVYRNHLLLWQGSAESEEVYPALVAKLFQDAAEPTLPEWSPYLDAARQRAAALTPEEREAARERAEKRPLVLVDWNFETAAGHGRQVRAVVDLLLEKLGLNFLATENSIIEVDLDRTRESARTDLLARLAAYRTSKGIEFSSPFSSVERWIVTAIRLGCQTERIVVAKCHQPLRLRDSREEVVVREIRVRDRSFESSNLVFLSQLLRSK